MIFNMKRRTVLLALTLGLVAGVFSSCSTVETRVADHPEILNSLSPDDQALVREGRIRAGMSQNAVWLAWGSPNQKASGDMRGRQTDTWIYANYVPAYGYGSPYGYGYPYGPSFGFGFSHVGVFHRHGHSRFVVFGDPFFDPFFYPYIPPSVPVPYKTVTFAHGRVISFQYLVGAYP